MESQKLNQQLLLIKAHANMETFTKPEDICLFVSVHVDGHHNLR